jgi:hypothetical protein
LYQAHNSVAGGEHVRLVDAALATARRQACGLSASPPPAADDTAGLEIGEIRDATPPPVKTCFVVGAVLRVCEVFRFLLEHRSLGVTLVCSCCSSERGASSVGWCFSMAARKQERSRSSRWKCR